MAAKALRNIEKLAGKSYKAGEAISDAVIAKITPQVLRSLVENHTIEVPGMEAKGAGTGGMAHVMARLDQQADLIKKLTAANAAMEKRLDAIEGKKSATPAKPAASKRQPASA